MTSASASEGGTLGGPAGSEAEQQLVDALRTGDRFTFERLVAHYSPSMISTARAYVPSREVAEDVVQDTWLAVVQGLNGFEQRSRLQTWLFRILINIARTRGIRERRCRPFSSLCDVPDGETTFAAERFPPAVGPGHGSYQDTPELRTLSAEALRCVRRAVAELPERQRIVVTLRDVVGASAEEVCARLCISEANQRVLLHRARSWIRRALEQYDEDDSVPPKRSPELPRAHAD